MLYQPIAPSQKFMMTFGAWNMLAAFLGAKDFLRLQAINRYAYHTSISRSQPEIWIKMAPWIFTRNS